MSKLANLYIDGQWKETEDFFEVSNPYTTKVIAAVSAANPEDVRKAIRAASRALPEWKKTTVYERSALLKRTADKMTSLKESLSKTMVLESGKTIQDARNEVQASIDNFYWYSEEIKRMPSEIIPSKTGTMQVVQKGPIGVVALMTPWNFPLNLVTRKLAPALAAGNTVLLKPSSETPLCSFELFKILNEIGFPDGVINLITGNSTMISDEIMKSPEVRKISFTGSTEIGKLLYEKCSSTLKKMSLELGGNAPFIVFEDADLNDAVQKLVLAKKRNTGQVCTCPNRILVHEAVQEAFINRLVAEVRNFHYGDPLKAATDIGPLINKKAVGNIERLIQDAVKKGAQIEFDAKTVHELPENFSPIVVLSHVDHTMSIYNEEIFGPVFSIILFKDEEEAILRANETEYGLASYLFTASEKRIVRVAEQLDFGLFGINEVTVSTTETPFGGVKYSGMGRENGKYGLEEYLEIKFINYGWRNGYVSRT